MNKKKVMLLMTGLHYGGMERVVFIAQRLLKENYDISVVTLYANNADYTPTFEYIDLNCPPRPSKLSKIFNTIKRTIAVKKIKKEIKPDIVMSFGTAANFSNVISKGKDKVVVGIRSYDWLTNYFASFNIDKWVYNHADRVVSVSKVISYKAEELFNIDKFKSKVLYNPYDIDYINKRAIEKITEIEISENENIIVSVGRLVNQKGFNHLIKSFSLVVKKHPNTKLLIIGHGEKEIELRMLTKELGIDKNVVFLGGQDNPYKFMKHANLYVVSSLTEGFPNAMVEAMSVGLPILAVDCKSGPREILSECDINKESRELEMCEFGVIIPEVSKSLNYDSDTIEKCDYEIANAINYYLDDSNLREFYSKKAYERAKQFTYSKFKSNLIEIFEEL
ncbi:glycosyltransferase [Paraclostridium sordellii]|uniref:glycosyltransferase n=1 Tax=Paraclostridium sordellii TaxID=1505 RepID=UPI0005E6AB5D|nr:glycosyltransferase [Paeniclostridium sordellii]CEP81822.1 group 1 glycosyl transferase [[Clostridium] sordellii] [Paeniclostridium sordellii]